MFPKHIHVFYSGRKKERCQNFTLLVSICETAHSMFDHQATRVWKATSNTDRMRDVIVNRVLVGEPHTKYEDGQREWFIV